LRPRLGEPFCLPLPVLTAFCRPAAVAPSGRKLILQKTSGWAIPSPLVREERVVLPIRPSAGGSIARRVPAEGRDRLGSGEADEAVDPIQIDAGPDGGSQPIVLRIPREVDRGSSRRARALGK